MMRDCIGIAAASDDGIMTQVDHRKPKPPVSDADRDVFLPIVLVVAPPSCVTGSCWNWLAKSATRRERAQSGKTTCFTALNARLCGVSAQVMISMDRTTGTDIAEKMEEDGMVWHERCKGK